MRFDVPVEGCTLEDLVHGDIRAADKVLKALILNCDRGLYFVERGLDGRNTGGELSLIHI